MNTTLYQNIGAKLRACRKAQHITLHQLAQVLNKSVATISKYEKGEIAVDLETLLTWCKYFNMDVSVLLPGTQTKSADLCRYKEHFIQRLYLYSYLGEEKRIHLDIIENDNDTMQSTLYLDVKDTTDIYDCSFVYSGNVAYSDANVGFVFYNTAPPFDMITFSMSTLTKASHYKTGILTSISFTYRNIALKVLAATSPITDMSLLQENLLFSKEDIKEIKRYNFFVI